VRPKAQLAGDVARRPGRGGSVVARINSRVTQVGQILNQTAIDGRSSSTRGELSIPKYPSFVAGKQNFCEQRQNAPTVKRVKGRIQTGYFATGRRNIGLNGGAFRPMT
jgi:hypothetical protein